MTGSTLAGALRRTVPLSRFATNESLLLVAAVGASMLLPSQGRPAAVIWTALAVAVVALLTAGRVDRAEQVPVALLVAMLPAAVLLGAIHQLSSVEIALPITRLLTIALWAASSLTLGRSVAERLRGRRTHLDVWVRITAVSMTTAWLASALTRLLGSSSGTAARLTWMLNEEDNAQIVGIAREVLTDGPRGAQLADQFGTAFVTLPLTFLRLAGGPLASEPDVRMQAVTIFHVSTLVVILLAGLTIALLAAFPHHLHPSRRHLDGPRDGPSMLAVLTAAPTTVLVTLMGFSLLIVLPMRTGFLTFVWGLALVLMGAALVAVTPSDAPPAARLALLAHLAGLVVLLIGSWPFIAPGLVPLLLVPLLWFDWSALRRSIRAHRVAVVLGSAAGLIVIGASATWFLRSGPAAEVLSYGLDILLVEASGIYADDRIRQVALWSVAASGVIGVAMNARHSRILLLLAFVGPVAGAGLLYGALRVAATVLTDGRLFYSGIKLFYGIVALATVLGLLALLSAASRAGTLAILAVASVLAFTHQTSETASLHTSWQDRMGMPVSANAVATVEALERTSVEVPIRCLPSPDTPITVETRWAAYFCARWVEDAFNEGRFNGRRDLLLNAEGETFEPLVERILAEHPSEYLFAYRMTMGPGWFGWSGRP